MNKGILSYRVSITQDRFSNICDQAVAEAISSKPMDVNGVEVNLKKSGQVKALLEGKSFVIDVPLEIDLKRNAGLFTIEGNGGLSLEFKLNYDISPDLQLKVKSELVSHKWIRKPELEFGALNIPIETLMNLVLGHYESILTAKIDEAINKKSDLMPIVYQALQGFETMVERNIPLESTVDVRVGEMSNMMPKTSNDMISMSGTLELEIGLQEKGTIKDDQLPTASWVSEIDSSRPIRFYMNISYADISSILVKKLHGVDMGGRSIDISDVEISYDDKLNISLNIDDPIKGTAHIAGIPSYSDNTEELLVDELDVKVNPSNFIYKMTTPLVNKFIEGKLEEFLPLDFRKIIDESLENLPKEIEITKGKVKPKVGGVRVNNIDFLEDHVMLELDVLGAHLDVEL